MLGVWTLLATICLASGCTHPKTPAEKTTTNASTDGAPADDTPSSDSSSDTSSETGDSPEATEGCTAWGTPEVVGEVSDSGLDEISGVVASRRQSGVLWVHEDSGAGPFITALSASGETLATVHLVGASSIDWEDIALAPCEGGDCLWIGDFGDNDEDRDDTVLLRVPEPLLTHGGGALEATPEVFPFGYPEGPQNAEALVVNAEGVPYVLTKRTDASTRVYRVATDGSGEATHVATVSTGPTDGLSTSTTAADLWPNGSRLVVRGYLYSFELELGAEGMDGAADAPHTQVQTGVELQGEAIAYDAISNVIWHVGEGSRPPIWRIPCAD